VSVITTSDTKTILITGSSSGIGRACALQLAEQGHQVVATARKTRDLQELETHDNIIAIFLDLEEQESFVALLQEIERRELEIDVLINNAGILLTGLALATPVEQVSEIFAINVFGTFRLIQMIIPHLMASQGLVINLSSDSGLVTFPYTTIYSMTKYAIEALTDGLRAELQPYDITVTTVEPGNTRTDIVTTAHQKLKQIEIPEILQAQHEEIKYILEQPILVDSQPPDTVATCIREIIDRHSLKQAIRPRYFVGTPEESKFAIQSLFETIHHINSSSTEPMDRESLIAELDFALNLE